MSQLYAESNDEGSKDLFEKRNYYGSKLSKTGYKNVVDFNFGEKFFYGRVNRVFVPMILRKRRIKRFSKINATEAGQGAVNFVVDAFNDMAQQFQRCAVYGTIDTSDQFLTNIKVHKAYQNPNNLYRNHRKGYFGSIAGIFRARRIRVRDFDDFVNELMVVLQDTVHRLPITKTGFIKNKSCPILCSGLAIEIADIDPINDQKKINQFVNSKNWNFYLNACSSYGFMVDKNMPWRIVADIGNRPTRSPMLDYSGKYGAPNPNLIISNYYTNVHSLYYQNFKSNILNLYNRVKLRNFSVIEECGGTTVTRIVTPITYTNNSFLTKFPDKKLLKIYFNIRVLEEETGMTDNEISHLLDDCIEIYMHAGVVAALNAFERIINEPFDKRGSLSYIKKHVDAIADTK